MERGSGGGGERREFEGGEGGRGRLDPHERSRPGVGGLAPMGGIDGRSHSLPPQQGGNLFSFSLYLSSVATLA